MQKVDLNGMEDEILLSEKDQKWPSLYDLKQTDLFKNLQKNSSTFNTSTTIFVCIFEKQQKIKNTLCLLKTFFFSVILKWYKFYKEDI